MSIRNIKYRHILVDAGASASGGLLVLLILHPSVAYFIWLTVVAGITIYLDHKGVHDEEVELTDERALVKRMLRQQRSVSSAWVKSPGNKDGEEA